jgi:hypothetical protein
MDPQAMPLWCWEARRTTAPLHPHPWHTTPHGPLCLRYPALCRHTPSPPGALAAPPGWHGAGPCRPARRGRPQRGAPPLWWQHQESLARARAAPWLHNPRRVCAWPQPFVPPRRAGEALSTRGQQPGAPDASPGWTRGVRARAPRVLWARPGGRPNRQRGKKARPLWGQGSAHPGARPRRTEGAPRSGRLVVARGRQALRHGTRGRPKPTRPPGGTGRRQHPGAHRQRRGPQRPRSPAPSPAPPATAQPLATPERPAPHRAACPTARRRRGAAERRRPTMAAQQTGRRQAR